MESILKIYTGDVSLPDVFLSGEGGVEICSWTCTGSRMGVSTLSCEVRWSRCLDSEWVLGSWVEFRGERWLLVHCPGCAKRGDDGRWVHSVEFMSESDVLLSYVYLVDAVRGDAQVVDRFQSDSMDVYFFGTLSEFCARFNAILESRGLSGRLHVGVGSDVEDGEAKLFVAEKVTLMEALSQAFGLWGVPWYRVGGEVVFGWGGESHAFGTLSYGVSSELYGIERGVEDARIVTLCTGVGSEDNIPYYYPNSTPKGELGLVAKRNGLSVTGYRIAAPLRFCDAVALGDEWRYEDPHSLFDSEVRFVGSSAVSSFSGVEVRSKGETTMNIGLSFSVPEGSVKPYSLSFGLDLSSVVLSNATGRTCAVQDDRAVCLVVDRIVVGQSAVDDGVVDTDLYSPTGKRSDAQPVCAFTTLYEDMEVTDRTATFISSSTTPHEETKVTEVRSVPVGYSVRLNSAHIVAGRTYTLSVRAHLTTAWSEKMNVAAWADQAHTVLQSTVIHSTVATVAGTLDVWQGAVRGSYWVNGSGLRVYSLSDLGLACTRSPRAGEVLSQQVLSYIHPQPRLMPSVYRSSLGAERFYPAINESYTERGWTWDPYINPATGVQYVFQNVYDPDMPREHYEEFDDIRPSIKGMTYGGQAIDVLEDVFFEPGYDPEEVEEGTDNLKYDHFYVRLRPLGFDLFSCIIDEGEMTLSMTSGACGACNFKVLGLEKRSNEYINRVIVDDYGMPKVDPSTGRVVESVDDAQAGQQDTTDSYVWIKVQVDAETYGGTKVQHGVMPDWTERTSAGLKPEAGDTFVILHILLPQAYILAAEKRLEEAIIDLMYRNNADSVTWSVEFSRVWLAQNLSRRDALDQNSSFLLTWDGETHGPVYATKCTWRFTEGEALPEISVELGNIDEYSPSTLSEVIATTVSDLGMKNSAGSSGSLDADLSTLDARYLRKDIADTDTNTPSFSSGATFGDYVPGVGGAGAGVSIDSTGASHMEVDFLDVRRRLSATSLEAERVSAVNGRMVISAASGVIRSVELVDGVDGVDGWKCWMANEASDGSLTSHSFVAGDQAMCQKFSSTGMKYYWRLVSSVGPDWIILSRDVCASGSDEPASGDEIVQLGCRSMASRRSAQVLSAYGDNTPSIILYDNITGFSLTNREVFGVVCEKSGNKVVPKLYNYGNMYFGRRDKAKDYIEYDDSTGTFTIKADVVFKAAQSLDGIEGFSTLKSTVNSLSYLGEAFQGSTAILGGLILTSLIQLGMADGDDFNVMAGINGVADDSQQGNGIAAWYGGSMVDREVDESATGAATSLFRFDGSGYVANTNISWDADGNVRLSPEIIIGDSSADTLNAILTELAQLKSWFEYDAGTHCVRLKAGTTEKPIVGFYTQAGQSLSAGGVGSGSTGGEGGVASVKVNGTVYPPDGEGKVTLPGYSWGTPDTGGNADITLGAVTRKVALSTHTHDDYIEDAPSDGSEYVRKDGSWVTSSGQGGSQAGVAGADEFGEEGESIVLDGGSAPSFSLLDIPGSDTTYVDLHMPETHAKYVVHRLVIRNAQDTSVTLSCSYGFFGGADGLDMGEAVELEYYWVGDNDEDIVIKSTKMTYNE